MSSDVMAAEGSISVRCVDCKKTAPCIVGWCDRDVCAECLPKHQARCAQCRACRFTERTSKLLKKRPAKDLEP